MLCPTQGHVTVFSHTKGHARGLCHAMGHVGRLYAPTWYRGPPSHHHRGWGWILPEFCSTTRHAGRFCHTTVPWCGRGEGWFPPHRTCSGSLFDDQACRLSLPYHCACIRIVFCRAVWAGVCRGTRHVGVLCPTKRHASESCPTRVMWRATHCTTTRGRFAGIRRRWANFGATEGMQAVFAQPHGMAGELCPTTRHASALIPTSWHAKERCLKTEHGRRICRFIGDPGVDPAAAATTKGLVAAWSPALFSTL